ncbi:hypothetical protein [Streptomyces sp. NPDC058307]|uniref:hypothetical protein n=1 Tax=Streptomyces sp. NPDC058307 TaxID=3346439 RepID=UPI0036E159B1
MTVTTTATVMISAQTIMVRAGSFSICLDSPLITNPLLCSLTRREELADYQRRQTAGWEGLPAQKRLRGRSMHADVVLVAGPAHARAQNWPTATVVTRA